MKAFFGKIWAWIKSTATKAWTWSVAHKAIAITTAAVVVAGATCAIVLPIALHEHSYSEEWTKDATNHWHVATCQHEEEIKGLEAHAYDNDCDTTCNVCGYERTVGAHVYDNDCDTTCNVCNAERMVGAHVYDNDCDTTCNVCNAERTVGEHVYDNACDTDCNECGATRTITHDHADTLTAGETTHWYACSVCGDKKDETAHAYTLETANADTLKTAATATTKAVYYKSCVCGAIATTDEFTFETDKTVATLANIQDLSKTYDKVELANPTYETNSDGAVTIEWYQGNTKLDAKPVNAGTYKVKVIIAESATYTGISAEKEFTIAKKVLSNLSVDLTYAGTNSFEVPLGAANGILAGDVADGIKVCITFANKNVGAAVTGAGLDAEDGDNYTNYELDLTTCTANIVPKTLNYLNLTKVYDGKAGYNDSVFFLDTTHGLVAGDVVSIETNDDAEYNVGTYALTDTSGRWELDDCIYLEGADAANYAFNYQANGAVATITVTPKVLFNLTFSVVYNGSTYHAGVAIPNGVVADDEVLVDIDLYNKNAGTYTCYAAGKETSVCWEDITLDGADYENYEVDRATATVTVTKRPIWAENTEFVYDGCENFCGDEYPVAILQNVVAGDTVELYDITWYFDSKNVDATLVKVNLSEEYNPNYTIDFSKCSASIIPRVIDNLTYEFEYNGVEYQSVTFEDDDIPGIVADDSLFLEVCFESPNVGAALDTSDETGFEPGFNETNYVLGTTYEFSIIPREIWVTGAQFYYDGYTTMMDDIAVNGITIHNAASTEDEYYMGGFFVFTFDNKDAGSNLINVTLSGLEESFINNYKINVSKCEAEILPAQLTNLKLQITEVTFENGKAYLTANNGIAHGDEVYIEWTQSGHNNTAAWKERGSTLVAPHTGMAIQGEAQVTLAGAAVRNYELALTNNKYGTMEYSEKCKPDVYGYCNCGANHTISTFKSTDVIATVPVGDASWEGGIYALNTTEPGYWNIQPNENYCTVTVYSPYGAKVTMKGFEFEATMAGTYYVHITKKSDTASGDAITFRYAERIFDVSSNQSGFYESNNLDGVNGAYYYFKVNKDTNWGASLLLKDGDENVLEAAKYEVKLYDTNFNEITDFIYDGSDIYDPADENKSIVGTNFYIMVTLKADTEFYICVF